MASLLNYLLMHRKRMAFSQEEVAFLLGVKGESRGSSVSRDENSERELNLRTALAYEAIYGKPVRELFAGTYEQVEREVAHRAKILMYRKGRIKPKRHGSLINLALKLAT